MDIIKALWEYTYSMRWIIYFCISCFVAAVILPKDMQNGASFLVFIFWICFLIYTIKKSNKPTLEKENKAREEAEEIERKNKIEEAKNIKETEEIKNKKLVIKKVYSPKTEAKEEVKEAPKKRHDIFIDFVAKT